jgi:hypothetical protein
MAHKGFPVQFKLWYAASTSRKPNLILPNVAKGDLYVDEERKMED